MANDVFLTAGRRTPIGGFQGLLSSVPAVQLGAAVVRAVLTDSKLPAERISEVILGCVLQAGVKQGPARQAALGGGIPSGVPTATINKLCGSGMKAIMLGYDQIRSESAAVVLAGGFESMSNAPYLLLRARQGYRMGHDKVYDHMYLDALLSPYDDQLMGCFADATAAKYSFTREQQDAFAAESVKRAVAASDGGAFTNEITPVTVQDRKGTRSVTLDETPYACDIAKIPTLRPAFSKTGTVTAASSSSISDGAAAVMLMKPGHDCSNATVDAWARANVQPVLDSAAYQAGQVAVFIWYDEDFPVPNLEIAPTAVPGLLAPPVTYASTLRASRATT